MNTQDAELANMIAWANAVVSDVKEPVGHPGWWSYQHQLSMIADISTIFKIDVDEYMIKTIINTTNDIGMTKYRIGMRFLWLLRPGQMAVFNGIPFEEAAKSRTRALGFAFIEVCTAMKLGKLDVSEITSDKGIRILKDEFKQQLKKPRPS